MNHEGREDMESRVHVPLQTLRVLRALRSRNCAAPAVGHVPSNADGTLDCGSLLPLWRASLGDCGGASEIFGEWVVGNSSASLGTESGSEQPQSKDDASAAPRRSSG